VLPTAASPTKCQAAATVATIASSTRHRTATARGLWVVVDEAVLARVTGGSEVMREQLLHLAAAAERPNVTVQVIGFEYGAHPGGQSHFITVDTGHGLPDLVYIEGLRGPAEFTSEAETQRYREVWKILTAIALSPRQSRERIEEYIERLAH
jgi:hypothetical protein